MEKITNIYDLFIKRIDKEVHKYIDPNLPCNHDSSKFNFITSSIKDFLNIRDL